MTDSAIPLSNRKTLFSFIIYPGVMVLNLALFYLLLDSVPLPVAAYIPIITCAVLISLLEKFYSARKEWTPNRPDIKNDALFMVVVQMILPRLLGFTAALFLLQLTAGRSTPGNLWPHTWPVSLQVITMILMADFLRYWLHRWSHLIIPLWRLHAVHHSPKKLYWLNVGRFHPLEKCLQYCFDALPFILFGVSERVLALYFVFYAVNGFFQHCNIRTEMGVLNKIISGPQLHRWHHSRRIEESNSNYGNNIIIWDIVFGSYFYPPHRQVGELGLINREYPLDFTSQLSTPFSGNIDNQALPKLRLKVVLLNFSLMLKMKAIQFSLVNPLLKKASNPLPCQLDLMRKIMQENKDTEYGKAHDFASIYSLEDFQRKVPLSEYEDLRPYIEKQEKNGAPALTQKPPVMYNQTSGTTGQPKYIPVTRETLDDLKATQRISSWYFYQFAPEAFRGRLLGIVSPAHEGRMSSGVPYGSASGHIYANMPFLARIKYILPPAVFAIEDYTAKYYIMTRIAAAHKSITFMGSANPTTFHKIEETLKNNFTDIIEDIRKGACKYLEKQSHSRQLAISPGIKANAGRARELQGLGVSDISLTSVWPYLQLITTWTRAGCGIALNSLLKNQSQNFKISELGYLASELRGTLVVDPGKGLEIPNLNDVFFEFGERQEWESGRKNLLTLERLEPGKEYYLVATTKSGLYRYNMNDVVKVNGQFLGTPTIEFIQKGKGVTNITGEKLYESHVINAMQQLEEKFHLSIKFFLALADEDSLNYHVYLELTREADTGTEKAPPESELAGSLDIFLKKINLEYQSKRDSLRLKPLILNILKPGTYEAYKKHKVGQGLREGQFKVLLLIYARDSDFNWKENEN